ncbi:MAG: DoxX family membrane protein [Opitutaceae bacterium]|nr:DoxX family membrane protein [Cytophagales bacterium]
MKYINQFCRFSVGLLFIISGLIKLNDPIGTAIKMEEYFEVFATDISLAFQFLVPYSLGIAIAMIVLEVVLGVAVLIYYEMKTITWLLLVLILFFTCLTFYSAYFNKVTDCGCFGDALKLTPWTSFIKDIVLIALILVLFLQRDRFKTCYQPLSSHIIMGLVVFFSFYMAYFTINHLSFVDFRAYKNGANIPKLMKASAPVKYKYLLTKGGSDFEFDTYPSDTSYKYKSMEVVNKQDLPKITDYAIWNDEGDFTQESLMGKKLLIFILDANKASTRNIEKIKTLVKELESKNVITWLVTASDQNSMATFRNENQLAIPVYFADATVIKTIIRSNPGLVLMQDGVVRGKWHFKDTPQVEDVMTSFKDLTVVK